MILILILLVLLLVVYFISHLAILRNLYQCLVWVYNRTNKVDGPRKIFLWTLYVIINCGAYGLAGYQSQETGPNSVTAHRLEFLENIHGLFTKTRKHLCMNNCLGGRAGPRLRVVVQHPLIYHEVSGSPPP